jgi:protein deglycase
MARVLVPIAPGSEELEAVTVIDLLRRAEIEVVVAGLVEGPITCSRGTVLVPDTTLDRVLDEEFDMIVLPGGLPGAQHLWEDGRVLELLRRMAGKGRYTAAICAAPRALAEAGLLEGRQATSFPGFLEGLDVPGLALREDPVVQDGRVITSRGPGTAMDFALHLIEELAGRDARDGVEVRLQRPAR